MLRVQFPRRNAPTAAHPPVRAADIASILIINNINLNRPFSENTMMAGGGNLCKLNQSRELRRCNTWPPICIGLDRTGSRAPHHFLWLEGKSLKTQQNACCQESNEYECIHMFSARISLHTPVQGLMQRLLPQLPLLPVPAPSCCVRLRAALPPPPPHPPRSRWIHGAR